LLGHARRAGVRTAQDTKALALEQALTHWSPNAEQVALSELRNAPDPSARALNILMRRVSATAGYLYLTEGDELKLAAAVGPDEPTTELQAQIHDRIHGGRIDLPDRVYGVAAEPASGLQPVVTVLDDDDDEGETAFIPAVSVSERDMTQIFVLNVPGDQNSAAIGAVVLHADARDQFKIGPELLESIAAILQQRHACQTTASIFQVAR
ncbi:MAG TPA: hypothetical protein VK524_27615, partial [Polyangiaceae bacterium]|nr:hypothetical protein [Polyangiaceae bacterium]